MKVAIGLSFFDKVKEIPRAMDPVYKHVDYVIGIDGRYKNYETDHDYSIDGSYELVRDRYPNSVVEKFLGSQVQKRQRYLDIAGELKCDYLIVWDSDDFVHPEYQDWDFFYDNLERYSKHYKDYQIFQMKAWIPEGWRNAHNAVEFNAWRDYVRIHKDPGNQRYALECHFWWCAKDTTNEDLIMQRKGMWKADHTIEGVRITTDSKLRDNKTLDTRDGWAWNNDCEEKRRLYIIENNINYKQGKLEFNGFWRYDKVGRPVSKICD